MNFKKNWKRFWTLSSAREGFTLVELIVVIAILAILAGVAVPAYSGYVTKANMQADITLISEIEHALQLAYYNGDLTEGEAGYLILSPVAGESFTDIEDVALAMEKTFGANWLNMMQLKYDNWGAKSMSLSSGDAQTVVSSNFVQLYSPNELMSQVQAMTDAVNGLSFQVGNTAIQLYDMFGYTDENGVSQNSIIYVMDKYGLGDSEEDWNALSSTEKSNLLVLATASAISNGQESNAASLIPEYALYTAYAAENAEFNAAYQTFQNTINNIDPNSADSEYEQIKNAYKALQAAAGAGFTAWAGDADDPNSNAYQNMAAFEAIMAGVGNAMKDNGDAILSDLGNADMFTTGIGNELYTDYLNTAYATAGNGSNDSMLGLIFESWQEEGVHQGEVVVYYTVADGKLYVQNTLLDK